MKIRFSMATMLIGHLIAVLLLSINCYTRKGVASKLDDNLIVYRGFDVRGWPILFYFKKRDEPEWWRNASNCEALKAYSYPNEIDRGALIVDIIICLIIVGAIMGMMELFFVLRIKYRRVAPIDNDS